MKLGQLSRLGALTLLLSLLSACSGTGGKAGLTELPTVTGQPAARQAWREQLPPMPLILDVRAHAGQAALASANGTLTVLDVASGARIWQATGLGELMAGVGFDGQQAAVVTRDNHLVVLAAGRELWRQRLAGQSFTAPLVAGGRVFVLGADRSVQAYDGQSGRRLWTQQRTGEALVLRQAGVLLAVRDTLVAGLANKLVGLNPLTGSVRWEQAVANPRGTNDMERLVDLVGPASRDGDVVCVRAFQAAVGCVDAARGELLWSKPAAGHVGLGGDARLLVGSEADGTLIAWRRSDGERVWSQTALRQRAPSAPRLWGVHLVVGDDNGLLHFVNPVDGGLTSRLSTDGGPLAAAPLALDKNLLVATRAGTVIGLRAE